MKKQIDLFPEFAFEIRRASIIGKYAVVNAGKTIAETFGLDTACNIIRVKLADLGVCYRQRCVIADAALKKYRSWEDAQ